MSPVNDPDLSRTRRFESAREADRAYSASLERWTYLIPLIMLIVGFLIGAGLPALTALRESGMVDAAATVAAYLFMLACSVVFGTLALILTCKLFGSEGGPIKLVLLRMAGVFALALIAAYFFGPLGCWGFLIILAIVAGLIALVFEMDLREAVFAAFFTWLIFLGFYILLSALLAG